MFRSLTESEPKLNRKDVCEWDRPLQIASNLLTLLSAIISQISTWDALALGIWCGKWDLSEARGHGTPLPPGAIQKNINNVKTALTTRQRSNWTNSNLPWCSPRKTAVIHDVYLIIQIHDYTLCRVYLDRQMMNNVALLSKSSTFTCTDLMLNWCPQLYFWRRTSLWRLCNSFESL